MAPRTRRHDPSRSSGRRGFTLVEVVVAIGLLSVVVLGLAGFAYISSKALMRSKELSVATIVAHETLDSLRSQPYASLVAENSTRSITSGKFVFSVTTNVAVDVRPEVHLLKQVTVFVANSSGRVVQRLQSSVFGGT